MKKYARSASAFPAPDRATLAAQTPTNQDTCGARASAHGARKMSRHGALAAHPDQGGSHAAFLDWQHGQAAVDAGDHDAGGGGNADYLPPLLTNVPHNNEASDDEVDANDATAAAGNADCVVGERLQFPR